MDTDDGATPMDTDDTKDDKEKAVSVLLFCFHWKIINPSTIGALC